MKVIIIRRKRKLVVVEFEAHAIMNLVIIVDCVPFLNTSAATSFFKSLIVLPSLHFTRTFFPDRSFKTTSIIFFDRFLQCFSSAFCYTSVVGSLFILYVPKFEGSSSLLLLPERDSFFFFCQVV